MNESYLHGNLQSTTERWGGLNKILFYFEAFVHGSTCLGSTTGTETSIWGELYSNRLWLARRGSNYPTLFFGGGASRAGAGRPGTLVCWRCGAFCCCVLCSGGGGGGGGGISSSSENFFFFSYCKINYIRKIFFFFCWR